MKFINLTPHIVRLNDGREFHPTGMVARVDSSYSEFTNDISRVIFGKIKNLPDRKTGDNETVYIVSAMVANAVQLPGEYHNTERVFYHRSDVVSPATGHPDCVRIDGQVYSVPGFILLR